VGLIAVDDRGLTTFDGYEWSRPPGFEHFFTGEIIDILPVSDGLFVVCDGRVVSLDAAGRETRLATVPRPHLLDPAFQRPDGSALLGLDQEIVELTTVAAGPRVVATVPPGAHTIHSVAEDSSGALWAVTDAGLFRRVDGEWHVELHTESDASRSVQFARAVK